MQLYGSFWEVHWVRVGDIMNPHVYLQVRSLRTEGVPIVIGSSCWSFSRDPETPTTSPKPCQLSNEPLPELVGIFVGVFGVTHFNFQTEFVWWVSHYLRSSWDLVECLLIFQSSIRLEFLVMFEPTNVGWKGLSSKVWCLGYQSLIPSSSCSSPDQVEYPSPTKTVHARNDSSIYTYLVYILYLSLQRPLPERQSRFIQLLHTHQSLTGCSFLS